MTEQIVFETDEGEVLFYVLEQTRISGVNYLLVSDSEDEEAECYVLKDLSKETDTEAVYEMVSDDDELSALFSVFSELLEDAEIRLEE